MPVLKKDKWTIWYVVVLAALFIQIAFYLWFTRYWQ
jgi:hypothetical protein